MSSGNPSPAMIQSRRAVYVGGLADTISEQTLRAAMIPFGPIQSIDIPRDYAKGTHRGFAFVEYEDPDDAAEAIYNMDGGELMGKSLTVNLAQAQRHKLGSNKAVWSTDEWFRENAGDEQTKQQQEAETNNKKMDVDALKEKAPVPSSST